MKELTKRDVWEIGRALEEFNEYVEDRDLIVEIYILILNDRNVLSNSFRKRMLRAREVLRDRGFRDIPFKLYREVK